MYMYSRLYTARYNSVMHYDETLMSIEQTPTLRVCVTDPFKVGDGFGAYTRYEVSTTVCSLVFY